MKQSTLLQGILVTTLATALLSCSQTAEQISQTTTDHQPITVISAGHPAVINDASNFVTVANIQGNLTKRLSLDVTVNKAFGAISVFSGDTLLAHNIDLPKSGKQTINVVTSFNHTGPTQLRLESRGSEIEIHRFTITDASITALPTFKDISAEIGLNTEITYKYGGPAVGDVNDDGLYDFVLNNHNFIPNQLVMNNGDGTVSLTELFSGARDYHGSSVGDYDNDNDLDIMVAFGGANGTSPSSYMLLRNDKGTFVEASKQAHVTTPARGRGARWSDVDGDGDIDLILFNAKTPNYEGPQQLFYQNSGDGTFQQVRVAGVEMSSGERVVMNDFNGDGKDDILMYSPVSLWQSNGDFTFTDVTTQYFPESIAGKSNVLAATDLDINNDGLVDFYFAKGRTHYQLSSKSIDFNPTLQKLDIRDDGEKGSTFITFDADNAININNINLTFRQHWGEYPIFLGANKTRKIVKATGFQVSQVPEEMKTAPLDLDITQSMAKGWADERTENGFYIGYIGHGKWQAEWVRNKNIYWNISFSLDNVTGVQHDWTANNRNVDDVLLLNTGNGYVDVSKQWGLPAGGNHWGVTHGDFNNDSYEDLFIHRYGYLHERISDLILINDGQGQFNITTAHGAHDVKDTGHGDMGQAFDFDLDGKVDLLNGSEEEGKWYLYQNQTPASGNYLLVDVGYSPKGNIDPLAAYVSIKTQSGKIYKKRIGSAGEVFSQSLLDKVHFGLGAENTIRSITVTWRNGEELTKSVSRVNTLYKIGE
ncbi:CRTAC1 family protein [Paraglaciecola aquimarina]|uniref:CRTAC1 family protein n=1 Tax=Paraglaciecola aquimarina TaxID=1235557 RepID=A0ABU3SZF6_9ALTE|nr:CRTAC1 family protein [Paraglaciecola aquimarina]MDU0355395.1 CRTAC1 family protein [Paraglaciecola aquimarina]